MTQTEILLEIFDRLEIKVKRSNNYYQCRAFWRDGNDDTSVAIYPDSNLVIDFVEDKKYRIDTLLKQILELKDDAALAGWLESNDFNIKFGRDITYIPKIELDKIFPKSDLDLIRPDHSYIVSRGVNDKVAAELGGGVIKDGKLKDRYVWPIWNSKGNLIGFTGRTLVDKKPKYKHLGNKKKWCWPCHVNLKDIIAAKEIILVESPMDVASLMTAGVRNVVALHGSGLELGLLNLIFKLNPRRVIISTNNDSKEDNGGVGQKAASKIYNSLTRWFNRSQIEIFLPPETKDWNEALEQRGVEYIKEQFKMSTTSTLKG